MKENKTIEEGLEAYQAGRDKVKNGANTVNCNFRHFKTPEMTKEWEKGVKDEEIKSGENNIEENWEKEYYIKFQEKYPEFLTEEHDRIKDFIRNQIEQSRKEQHDKDMRKWEVMNKVNMDNALKAVNQAKKEGYIEGQCNQINEKVEVEMDNQLKKAKEEERALLREKIKNRDAQIMWEGDKYHKEKDILKILE